VHGLRLRRRQHWLRLLLLLRLLLKRLLPNVLLPSCHALLLCVDSGAAAWLLLLLLLLVLLLLLLLAVRELLLLLLLGELSVILLPLSRVHVPQAKCVANLTDPFSNLTLRTRRSFYYCRHQECCCCETQTRTLSGPPSTGASIAMDGGVTDGAVYDNTS
jgi:hypothetical protein